MKHKRVGLILLMLLILIGIFYGNTLWFESKLNAASTTTMPSYGTAHLKVADISSYNDSVSTSTDDINFALLQTQVDAIYIRAFDHSNGLSVDRQARNYANSAQKVGLKYGFYFYYIPTNDPADAVYQAQTFYAFIKNYAYSCIPVVDAEDNTNNLSKAEFASAIKTFADTFRSISGLKVMVYSYPYFMYTTFDTTANWSDYMLWIAHYNVSAPMEGISATYMPASKWCWKYWDMWQYTSTGTLSSIPNSVGGHLDLSYATDNILLAPPQSASITSVQIPDTVEAGKLFTTTITVMNTDKVAWTENTNIRLGFDGNVTGIGRALLPTGVSVAPGDSYTFSYDAIAPVSGDLVLSARMLKESVCWFGETKTVTVKAKDAQIVSVAAPAATLPNAVNTVQVTMKNTGLTAWSEGQAFRLGTFCGAVQNRVCLPAGTSVAPGETYTFSYTDTAPAAGNLTVYLQMLQEGVCWFGEGKSIQIPVTNPVSAEITSVVLSDGIAAGQPFTATITVKNTDRIAWTEKDRIRLGTFCGAVQNRVCLPAGTTVAPGESYTFTYADIAPTTGDLTLSVRMLQESVCWFGETKTVTVKAKDAQIVSVAAPAATLPNAVNTVQVTMKNTGLTAWSEGQAFRLGTFCGAVQNRVCLPAGTSVAPGETYTFSYTDTAPAAGNLTVYLQMLQEGVCWFGEGKSIQIPVTNPVSAEITSVVLSDGIAAGQPFTATITVKNTDRIAWTEKDRIRLGTFCGAVQNRVCLPAGTTVAPGESYTFTYADIAPTTGDLTLSVRMLQESVCWFGETKTVTVKAKDAQIVSVAAPAATLPNAVNTVQVTMKNTGLTTWSAEQAFRLGTFCGAVQNRVCLPAGTSVAPGETYTFSYTDTAPAAGNLTVYLQMLQEGVCWFGEGKSIQIPVTNPVSAEITSVVLSDGIAAGQPFTATITVKNTDRIAWTEKDRIRLGTFCGAVQNRVCLPAGTTVAPGESYTFTYADIAPASGDLTLSVRMLQESVCWFGETKPVTKALS